LDERFEEKYSPLTNIKVKYRTGGHSTARTGGQSTARTGQVFCHRSSRIADGKYDIVISVAAEIVLLCKQL